MSRATAQISLFDLITEPPKRKLTVVRRPSGEVAAERVYELLYEIGQEWQEMHGREYGWKAAAARKAGLNYATAWTIMGGEHPSLSTRTVDKVSQALNIPIAAFYDSEWHE